MRRILSVLLLVTALTATAQPRQSQPPQKLQLTIDTIMRGYGLTGWAPRGVRWANDNAKVWFDWKRYTDPVETPFDTYVVNADGSGLRKLTEAEKKDVYPPYAAFTRDHSRAVDTEHGDVYLYDTNGGPRRALTHTTAAESNARFTRDEQHVAFIRDNNLVVLSLTDGSEVQVTNIVAAGEKGANVSLFDDKDAKKSDAQKWVADEAEKLSDVLTRRANEKKRQDAERKAEIALQPLKLDAGQSVYDLQLTPDGRWVIASLTTEKEGLDTIVPSYVTESGYTTEIPSREKAGDHANVTKVASLSTVDGSVHWLQSGIKPVQPAAAASAQGKTTSKSTTATTKVEATAEKTEATKESAQQERDLESQGVFLSDDGQAIALIVRAADNKDWWLLGMDPATGKAHILFNEHDDAWVNWLQEHPAGFLPNSTDMWFLSEKSGWRHLYTVPFKGGTPRALTSGKYEVNDVVVSGDKQSFYVTSNRQSLHERHLYRMPIGGGEQTRITATTGWHDGVVSPDGTRLADIYSYTNRPDELFVGKIGTSLAQATQSPAPEFFSYTWMETPIVEIPARDGVSVPGNLYKPADWNGGPAVIFVHGAGYLQNVRRAWSYYAREYMFHHFLTEHGYLVLDIDYRASEGYGRDWRTAIYRHMGGKDLEDEVDAAKWLVATQKVDPKRIGMYGGSYGGFMTLMAMFTTPGVFASGAALRPVSDWAHYNHEYTSDILNTPQSDPEAYRKSSPIYFAEGLQGNLLICHGVVDTNVHFQDTVRLAQRLIELRKENWEVAMFPVENHGFVEPTSWADEYKRIFKLFERTLK